MTNPIVLKTVGDEIVGRGRVLSVLWVGVTACGDTVQLNDGTFWEGATTLTRTYQGAVWSPYGIPLPNGRLELTQISNGKVLIYFVEA